MSNIYAKAIITITSAHSEGAYGGMFVQRDGIRTMPFEILLRLPDRTLRIVYAPTRQREVPWSLGDLPLYKRAWCFQEQMLTTRNLIYDPNGVRWQCLTIAGTESDLKAGIARCTGNVMAYQNAIKRPTTGVDFFSSLASGPRAIPTQASIWHSMVRDYAARNLSQYTDRLIAIASVAQVAEKRTQNRCLAGLWKDHLFMNLLWFVATMPDPEGAVRDWVKRGFTLPYRDAETISPSWSWASVNSPISYESSTLLLPFVAWRKLIRCWDGIKPPVLEDGKAHVHPLIHVPLPSESVYHSYVNMKREVVEIV